MEESGEKNSSRELHETSHIVPSSKRPQGDGNVETHDQDVNFSSPTPVKTKEPSRVKCQEGSVEEFPENYRILSQLYDGMTSSLRLLKLLKRLPIFKNVTCQVEILTGRKFLLTHLAQIKYILPEAVQIDKVLIHDERTKCMKSDIKIALLFDVVEGHCEESVFIALKKLFSLRLRDFYVAHPEGTVVPEAALPEPFNQTSFTVQEDPLPKDLLASCDTESLSSSHFSPSFRRRFYEKATVLETKTNLLSPRKSGEENIKMTLSYPPEASICEATPVKLGLRNASLSVVTPVQSTPMRFISPNKSVLTCEDESKTAANQSCKQPSSTAKKSLDFYCLDDEDTKISPNEVSICLSDLVLLIHKIFQSVNFYPITKEELIQKIIMHNCEIDDQSEVEKQIEHLEKLVPDWFYKKLVSSGDIVYNVKKASDLKSIHERIDVT